MSKLVNVEGSEIALKNSNGDIVIVPKKDRTKVEQFIKTECWGCVDNYVSGLPKMSNYAKDGSVIADGDPPTKWQIPQSTQQYTVTDKARNLQDGGQEAVNKKAAKIIKSKKPMDGFDKRHEYLKQFTPEEKAVIKSSDNASVLEPSMWSKFDQAIRTSGAAGLAPSSNSNLTYDESKEESTPLNLLQPLNVIPKLGQALYRSDYTMGQALRGTPNNASAAEDALTDFTNYTPLVGAKMIKAGLLGAFGTKLLKNSSDNVVEHGVRDVAKNIEYLNNLKKFAKKYDYELPSNLERIAQSHDLTDKTIRGLMSRHNTYTRGVSTNWNELGKRNPDIFKTFEERGLDYVNNPEDAAKIMLTEVPPDTGYGRYMMNKGENAVYTSNSVPTAQGYTYGDGYYAKIRRKNLDFSSNNRLDWINNNQFDYQKGVNNPEGASIIKTDWRKRVPRNLEDFVKSTGNPDLLDNMQKKIKLKTKNKRAVIDKEINDQIDKRIKIYDRVRDEAKKRYPDYHTTWDNTHMDESVMSREEKKVLDFTSNRLDKLRNFDFIKYEDNQTLKSIFTTPEFYKSTLENLIKPDKFGHYAFKGTPGEQLFDIVNLKRMTPDIWTNKSRSHVGKYTKKLSAMESGGITKQNKQSYVKQVLQSLVQTELK